MAEAGNFQEGIHKADYEAAYRARRIADSGIAGFGRAAESLNGLWRYAVDQYDTCLRQKWFAEVYEDEQGLKYPVDFSYDEWPTMVVPSCWNTQAERLALYEGTVVYTRTFAYENHGEERVFLQFGAANYQAALFVNKQFMGTHLGGSTPFCVEVTGVLQKENRVLVAVNNTRRRGGVPCENTDWFNYGGLYRDISILRLPKAFIRRFAIGLAPGGFGKIRASVTIDGADGGAARLTIPELGVAQTIEIAGGKGEVTFDASPELWDTDNPKLYDVAVTFGKDKLTERVGFREIRADGERILLNGKPVFLKGVCAHEESVLNGKAVTEAEIRENFRLAKEMHCNYMRLAHYPHTEKAARIADEAGLLLWEEIPVYWAIQFDDPDTYVDAENQLAELIHRDINRASVIIWSVGNENADVDDRLSFMSRLAKKAKELDPSRLVSAACLVDHVTLKIDDRLAAHVDVIGMNEYYGWYEPDFVKLAKVFANSAPGKPVVVSEFGADARAGMRGTVDDLYTEDKQLAVYKKQIAAFKAAPAWLAGASPWILYDFRCPRRAHYLQDYYNLKGLLSADKTYKKPAYYAMQAFYAGIE